MDAAVRDEILGLIAQMKREATNMGARAMADRMAIGLITEDCRPHVMARGLHQWLGLTQPIMKTGHNAQS